MSRVGIADLKANLSRHVRSVKGGRSIVVVDRNQPVARLVPFEVETMEVRRAVSHPRDLVVPKRSRRQTDSLSVLLDDRRKR